MKCSKCGREHQNDRGKCPFCSDKAELQKKQKQKANDSEFTTFKNVIGTCPKRGQEVSGMLIRFSAQFLKEISLGGIRLRDTFSPDTHSCTAKSAPAS